MEGSTGTRGARTQRTVNSARHERRSAVHAREPDRTSPSSDKGRTGHRSSAAIATSSARDAHVQGQCSTGHAIANSPRRTRTTHRVRPRKALQGPMLSIPVRPSFDIRQDLGDLPPPPLPASPGTSSSVPTAAQLRKKWIPTHFTIYFRFPSNCARRKFVRAQWAHFTGIHDPQIRDETHSGTSSRSPPVPLTCEPVSTQLRRAEVWLFQKRMVRSAVPPPEASIPCWCGFHAMALTAAVWSLNRSTLNEGNGGGGWGG